MHVQFSHRAVTEVGQGKTVKHSVLSSRSQVQAFYRQLCPSEPEESSTGRILYVSVEYGRDDTHGMRRASTTHRMTAPFLV